MMMRLNAVILMSLLMLTASVAAVVLKPTEKLADVGPKVNIETMVPKIFGDWRIDESIVPLLPAPDVQARLNKIYNQTLARTYVNSGGQRIMLSIAYGGDQSDAMQVHLPEVCYAAQGFSIRNSEESTVALPGSDVPVRRVVAALGSRTEPITYWITVGDEIVNSGVKRKLAQLRYGISGRVPDGILVRVSSIGREAGAYSLHDGFLREMVSAMSAESRGRMIGRLAT